MGSLGSGSSGGDLFVIAEAEKACRFELESQARRSLDSPAVHLLFEAVSDFSLLLNDNLEILGANHRLLEALGQPEESLLGLRFGEVFGCLYVPEAPNGLHCRVCGAMRAVQTAQETGKSVDGDCHLTIDRDGRIEGLDFRVRATPLRVGTDDLTVFVFHDVGEKERHTVLCQTFFHDLLNEIGGIRAWSDMMGKNDPHGAARQVAVLAESLRDNVITQQSLMAAEHGELIVIENEFDASELWSRLELIFAQNHIAIDKTVTLLPLPERTALVSDQVLVLRVLVNMLKNAIEASEPEGTVAMWLEWRGNVPTFIVHNAGVISEDRRPWIFEKSPFTRAPHHRGIGTHSIKLYGERYLRGKVTFTSDEQTGTHFFFSLPPQDPAERSAAAKPAIVPELAQRRLLVIDDNQELLRLSTHFLSRLGYSVVTSRTGSEALDLFRATPKSFDAVIMDWAMPGISAQELCARLASIRDDIPVLVTAGMEVTAVPSPVPCSVRAWLRKPFTFQSLADSLKQIFEQPVAPKPPGIRVRPNSGSMRVQKSIQVVEDDPAIRNVIRVILEEEGFAVSVSEDGVRGLADVERSRPDLVVLDGMLPGLNGMEICRRLRAHPSLSRVPVLMISARNSEVDRVVGLESGADDFLAKPFQPAELAARVRALLRRADAAGDPHHVLRVGEMALDPEAVRLSIAGKDVPLTALEFHLLHFLASHPNRVFSREQLLDSVWGKDHFVSPRIVDVYIRQLRQKLMVGRDLDRVIRTVRCCGYMFCIECLPGART
jgi:DNA-binding response OmpR family regulator/PAS domain-containing protein